MDILALGILMSAGTLLVMDWELPGGLLTGPDAGAGLRHARTVAFTTLVLFQLFHTFNARFEDRSAFHRPFANRWLWVALAISGGLQVAVVHVPFLQRAFQTAPLGPRDWVVAVAVASSVLWAMEAKKLVARRRRPAGASGRAPAAGDRP